MRAAARTVLHFPVFGWFLQDALYGHPDAKYYFIGNLLFVFAALVYLFGYPVVILFGLTATAVMLTLIVILTASDMLQKGNKR